MTPENRRERITELVHGRGRISVEELATILGSSRETVRRDLGLLGDAGRIRKVHGGAMPPDAGREGPFAQRVKMAVAEKDAIGQAAAALFAPGDTIFVDAGTTTLMFACALARRPGLTVITNSTAIAATLGEAAKLFLIGGEYRAELGEMVGPLAVEQIERFHAAHAVLTVGALGTGGPMDYDLEEAHVARAMIRQARSVTLVADGSKLDRSALFQLCPLAGIDRLVTDRAPPLALDRALREAGVEVIVADPSSRRT